MTTATTDTTDTVSASTRRSILFLSFATFSSMCVQRICDAMLPELARVFVVSLGQAAQVVSVFAITYGVAQLIYGPLGDRLGKYRIITFGAFGCSVASLLAVFAGSFDMLLVARFLMSLSAAGLIPMAMAWVGDSVPTHRLQEMLTRTGLGSTLGLVAGQLLGGLLTDAFGWRWCFVFMALLFAVVGTFLLNDLRRQRTAVLDGPDASAHAAHAALALAPTQRINFIRQAFAIITGSWSRTVLAMAVVEGAVSFGVLAIWASHLHQRLGLSLTSAGAIVALFGLGGMLYMVLARGLIAHLGQQGLVIIGGALFGLCACVMAFTPNALVAIPTSLVSGFGFFMFHNTMQANATNMAPHARGTAVSLFSSFLFLGQSMGVLLAASLIDRVGSSAVISGAGVVMALEGVFFAWMLRRRAAAVRHAA